MVWEAISNKPKFTLFDILFDWIKWLLFANLLSNNRIIEKYDQEMNIY